MILMGVYYCTLCGRSSSPCPHFPRVVEGVVEGVVEPGRARLAYPPDPEMEPLSHSRWERCRDGHNVVIGPFVPCSVDCT